MSATEESSVPRWLSISASLSWRALIVIAALVVLGAAFSRLRVIAVPVILALFLSTVLAPPVRWLIRHGWPRAIATWLVFIVVGVIVASMVSGLLPTVRKEFTALGFEVTAGLKQTQFWLVDGPLHLSKNQVGSIVGSLTKIMNLTQAGIVRGALSGVTLAVELLGGMLLTVVLTFFFVKDGDKIWNWIVLQGGSQRRVDQLRSLGNVVWLTLTGYVRGTVLNGTVNGISLSIALMLLGVPLVLPIALVTLVGAFIPLVGGIVSGLLAALVALVTRGPLAALIVVGATVVIHNMEGYLTGPLVLGRAVKLHPVAILLVLATGSVLGGILGAFVAVPLASILAAIVSALRRNRLVVPDFKNVLRQDPGN